MTRTAEEHAAYQRGYAAGLRKKAVRNEHARQAREREAFRRRAFLAALQGGLASPVTWMRGEKQITSLPDRVALAWEIADEALKGSGL